MTKPKASKPILKLSPRGKVRLGSKMVRTVCGSNPDKWNNATIRELAAPINPKVRDQLLGIIKDKIPKTKGNIKSSKPVIL